MPVAVKRVYESASRSDGTRVLVDRLWPRGLRKADIAMHEWLRDLAPSNDLRKWLHAEPERWLLFRKRYLKELARPEAEEDLQKLYLLAQTTDAFVCLEKRNTEQRCRTQGIARRNAQTTDWHRPRRIANHAVAGRSSAPLVRDPIAARCSHFI
jgi:uncharacterized protein YeaO (DUF488 family)